MEDWREVIKERVDNYRARISEISQVLNSLAVDLLTSPYRIKMNKEFIENQGRAFWRITIENKTIEITEEDINRYLYKMNEYGERTEEKKDLKESLIDLILDKFKW